jgi:hypothetical protein
MNLGPLSLDMLALRAFTSVGATFPTDWVLPPNGYMV